MPSQNSVFSAGAADSRNCPHGLRPGTAVCLHCRQEARMAARHKRYRMAARAGLGIAGVSVVVVLGVGGWRALTPSESDGTVIAVQQSARRPVAEAAAATPPANTGLIPVVPEGRHQLEDSIHAVREGGRVTVNFDTELLRTRFDWKFEGILRATLPMLFGPEARAALDSVPSGELVRGDLLEDLPTRGISLKTRAHTIKVWPITRPGRDGPIVVGYRASGGG